MSHNVIPPGFEALLKNETSQITKAETQHSMMEHLI